MNNAGPKNIVLRSGVVGDFNGRKKKPVKKGKGRFLVNGSVEIIFELLNGQNLNTSIVII